MSELKVTTLRLACGHRRVLELACGQPPLELAWCYTCKREVEVTSPSPARGSAAPLAHARAGAQIAGPHPGWQPYAEAALAASRPPGGTAAERSQWERSIRAQVARAYLAGRREAQDAAPGAAEPPVAATRVPVHPAAMWVRQARQRLEWLLAQPPGASLKVQVEVAVAELARAQVVLEHPEADDADRATAPTCACGGGYWEPTADGPLYREYVPHAGGCPVPGEVAS